MSPEREKKTPEAAAQAHELTKINILLQEKITQLENTEALLRRTNERLHLIFDHLPIITYEIDPEGRWVLSRGKGLEKIGRQPDEVVGRSIFEHYRDLPEVTDAVRKALQGQPQEIEVEVNERIWNASYFPVKGAGGQVERILGIAFDMTERVQLEAQLRQAQKMEAIGQLTAGISHNFNNLLQGLTGNIELARLEAPAHIQPFLESMEQCARRGADLVYQLVLFSRNSKKAEDQPISPLHLLQYLRGICTATFDQKIRIEERLPEHLPTLRGDIGQLEQALMNLLINARDAVENTAKPCICIEADTTTATCNHQPSSPYVRIKITDNGHGMRAETQNRIFDPFFTTKPIDKGTGLGLSTAYGIVQEHGGWIYCTSQPGEGTTFAVYLPGSETADQATEEDEALIEGAGTILLIDDEDTVRHTTLNMLKQSGYIVIEAKDGRQGLKRYQQYQDTIDLVLLDLSMPDLSGQEVLPQLQAINPAVNIALFTGYGQEKEITGTACIRKPVGLKSLAKRIRELIASP